MKFFAINGSPRKNKNTATLLEKALEGAKSAIAGEPVETEMIHLYDLSYQSCISCFECKRMGGKSYGRCAVKDPLTSVLQQLAEADGIIFGSPVYFGSITGKMKSFLERFLFQYSVYDMHYSSLAPKKMPTAFIYTMNVTDAVMHEWGYLQNFKDIERAIEKMFTKPQTLYANDTYQFNDYSKYKMEIFSEKEKARHRDQQFPVDCQKAFRVGASLAGRKAADPGL